VTNRLGKLLDSYHLATKQPPPPGQILVHDRPANPLRTNPGPRGLAVQSSVQILQAAGGPAVQESVCRSPWCRSAPCRPQLVFKPFKPLFGVATPPQSDNPRLDPDFPRDRPGAAPVRCQQNNPRPFQITFVTGERQRASNALRSFRRRQTSLASGIIPILNHDSRSKKSGY
jgi:hypothetical protein